MYILKFHGRDELCQMYVSKTISILKMKAQEEREGKLHFVKSNENIFIYESNVDGDIGVIGPIEEI